MLFVVIRLIYRGKLQDVLARKILGFDALGILKCRIFLHRWSSIRSHFSSVFIDAWRNNYPILCVLARLYNIKRMVKYQMRKILILLFSLQGLMKVDVAENEFTYQTLQLLFRVYSSRKECRLKRLLYKLPTKNFKELGTIYKINNILPHFLLARRWN